MTLCLSPLKMAIESSSEGANSSVTSYGGSTTTVFIDGHAALPSAFARFHSAATARVSRKSA